MFFEDARDLALPALRLLESQKEALECPDLKIWTLEGFSRHAQSNPLTLHQKEVIVGQAIVLIDQFYAHLPFKRARYAADPVQSLRLIQAELGNLTDLRFHEQMLQTMVTLRDAHTFYSLPIPYQGAFAFLPFLLECFREKGKRKYIVTHVLPGFEHGLFKVNAEITSWNGVPTEEAVEREGLHDPGANPSSRLARSINRMCLRSLALSVPPKESFVVVGYVPPKGPVDEFGIVMPWQICTSGMTEKRQHGTTSSVNEGMAQAAQARKILFHREQLTRETGGALPDLRQVSKYPHVFEFQYSDDPSQPGALRDEAYPEKNFGYIRIRTFDLDPSDKDATEKFVNEFQRIVRLFIEVAPDGLILDVRSNPGGSIQAAERVLQFLTPGAIQPADFHFISSQTTRQIASVLQRNSLKGTVDPNQREWLPWVRDLLSSVTTGDTLTPGRPLTSPEDANDTGQLYQGPVTLIIDSLAYSATDIFCSGFQDHKIGTIIGVDENSGGGGANRWLHEELRHNLKLHGLHDFPLESLPAGAQLGVAIRRCSRVGDSAGNAIEDVGIRAEVQHQITRNDLLLHNQDLLKAACKVLGSQPRYMLKIDNAELKADGFEVTVTTRNLFRLECVVNTHFNQGSVAVTGGQQSFKVSIAGLVYPPELLQVNGFAQVDEVSGVKTLRLAATDSRLFDEIAPASTTTVAAAS